MSYSEGYEARMAVERLYLALRHHFGVVDAVVLDRFQQQVWIADARAAYPELVATLQARIRLEVE
jgi:hypothetical protein